MKFILACLLSLLPISALAANPQWNGANSNTPPFNYISDTSTSFNVNSLNSLYTVINVHPGTSSAKTLSLKGCSAIDKGTVVEIKDGDNNSSTYNITVTPVTGTINNSSNYVISTDGASLKLTCNGSSDWVFNNLSAANGMSVDAANANRTSSLATRNLGLSYTVKAGESIQTALTSAANGGIVFVQAGAYTITSPLIMSSGTSLICERGATITATSVGWTDPNPDPINGAHKVHVRNINHGNFNSVSDQITDHDLVVDGCNFATAGAFISDGAFHSIQFRKAARIRVQHNSFHGGANGTAMIGTKDTVVSDNSMGTITTGSTHTNTTLDNLVTTANVVVGDTVTGPGIPASTTVQSIDSSSSVTLSQATTATASGVQIIFGAAMNACWDHWEGPENFSVRDNTCGTQLYGVLATGTDTNGTTALFAKNGSIISNKIAMGNVSTGPAAIWFNGLFAGAGASNIIASDNTVIGDGSGNFVCWKISGAGTDNMVLGNTCRNSGTNSVGATVAADAGGTPSNTTLGFNTYDGIQVQAGSIGVIQLGGPNARSIGERITGGSYPYLVYMASTDNIVTGISGATGTTARFNTTGSTRPSILDVDPSDGTQRFYQNLGIQASSATLNVEDARAVAAGIGGSVALKGKNNNASQVSYAAIRASAVGATPGSEVGDIVLQSMIGGALSDVFSISANAKVAQLGAPAGNKGPVHFGAIQQTAPALTSCGTSPAISGTDTSGEVTMGTGAPAGCVITFNVAYAAVPYCTVTWQANLASMQYTVSTTAITLVQTATSSNKVNYFCMARAGG